MALPLSGVPRIIADRTASVDDALAVLSSRESWTLGELAMACLRQKPGPCVLIIDGHNGRVFVSDDENAGVPAINVMGIIGFVIVAPSEQKFLTRWDVLSLNTFVGLGDYFHPLNRRTFPAVIDKLAGLGAGIIRASQFNGWVTGFVPMGGAQESAATWDAAAVGGMAFQLTNKDTNRLAFE